MTIIFQAIDWYVCDVNQSDSDEENDNKNSLNYLIKIFGRDLNGKSVSVNINNYTPYFYLKGLDDYQEYLHNDILLRIKELINENLPFYLKGSLVKCQVINKKDIWGFTNNKVFKFILLSFKNHASMKKIIKLFSKPVKSNNILNKKKFKLYENNIEPYLRFIHKQNLEVSGWMQIKKYEESLEYNIKKGKNYVAKWKHVLPYNQSMIAPFIVASFDIECNSHDGSFPTASKTYNKVCYSLLEYFESLKNNMNTKEEIYNKIYDYILNLFKNETLNLQEKINLNNINSILNNYLEDIISILEGKLQYQEEKRIKTQKTLLNYFDSNIDNNDNGDRLSSTEIINKLTTKFDYLFPKLNGDPIIQIGTTFHKYGSKECYDKVILTLDTCSKLDNIKVIECKTEKDIIVKWVNIINQYDPDIITGYNIFGFDFEYIYNRAIELNCQDYLCNLGKVKECIKECFNENSFNYNNCDQDCSKYCSNHWVKKTLSSSALGDNYLKYINMEGRVLIDLMKEIQKNHKLDSYKLDFVSSYFMTGKIKDIKKENNKFNITIDNVIGIQVGDYIKIENSKYIIDNIDLNNNKLIFDIKNEELNNVKSMKWGLAKDDVSPQEIFKCQKGTADDRAKVAKYCIQDCALCNYLMIKLEIVANNIGMSNVCSIPFSYIFLRGQGVKIFSLVAKQCKEDNYLIPYLDKKWKCEVCGFNNSSYDELCQKKDNKNKLICQVSKPENEGFEGAIVLDPIPGIYVDAPISVLDYSSLYPSSMISENISHDTIILDEKYDNLPGYKYVDIKFDLFKGKGDDKKKIGDQTCRYVQFPKNEKGLLPRILQKLLKQRKATRKKITWKTIKLKNGEEFKGNIIEQDDNIIKLKVEDKDIIDINNDDIINTVSTYNEFEKAVLDGLQLAYKITANSLYGQVGAPTSPIFMKELAASTTAVGRALIISAKDFAEKEYNCKVVYGDTDSIFIKLPPLQSYEKYGHPTEKQNILQYNVTVGEKLSEDFQKLLKPPHCLEWEKMFYPFIIFSKKRYVGNLYEHDVNKFKQKSMGIVLKRRDNANIVKIIYGGVIDIILNEGDIKKSLEFLDNCLNKLSNGKYPLEELIVTKTLRGFYKNPKQIAHKVLADRMKDRDPGSAPQSNDRVPYVYIKVKENKNIKLLQGDKIEDPKFIIENNLTPDYGHYISNQIMKPTLQLYSMILEDLNGYKHRNDNNYWSNIKKNLISQKKDIKKVNEKIQSLKEDEVKELLFNKYLVNINNKNNGNTTINDYFKSK